MAACVRRFMGPVQCISRLYSSKIPEVPSKAVYQKNKLAAGGSPLVPSRNPNIPEDEGCWLCQNNLQDFDYRDVLVLDQFIRDGELKTAEELGVCTKMQKKLKGSIRKAIKHGLLPEDILTEEEYWSLGPERQPPVWSDTEHLYDRKFADLYPNHAKYTGWGFRLGPVVKRFNKNPVNDSPRCLGLKHFRESQKNFRRKNWKKEIRERENIF